MVFQILIYSIPLKPYIKGIYWEYKVVKPQKPVYERLYKFNTL